MTEHENDGGDTARVTDTPEVEALRNARLDELLQTVEDVAVSAQLQRRIAEIPLRHPRAAKAFQWWPWSSVWKSAVVAVSICVLGALVGASDVAASVIDDPVPTSYAEDEGLALAFGVSSDEDTAP